MRRKVVTRGVGPQLICTLALVGTAWCVPVDPGRGGVEAPPEAEPSSGVVRLNLEQCLSVALGKSHRRPASQFAVAMAEAQHRQTLAGYWPQVNVKGGYQRLDQPLNFVFPASAMQIPSQSMAVPGGAALVTIPANAFGPGFPPANVQLPVSYPGQSIDTPAQAFPIPQQDVKVMDRDVMSGAADVKWLLFDGGMRKGYRQQSGGFLAMMREDARRTDLELADSVKRLYWGAVLARQLHRLGSDTLERMEATLRLTETMYKEGAGRVTKADYLDNLVTVETIRSMVAQLEKNEAISQAALANTIGYSWKVVVQPVEEEIPFEPFAGNLEQLVSGAYQFSPDWAKLEAAIGAAGGAVTTARSGYYPKVAFTGELHRWWNGGYSGGMSTRENRAGWSAGFGLEFPLFDGFLTRNKVSETLARVRQLKEMRFLLQEGLGLQVRDVVLGLDAASKSYHATLRAMKSAEENRDLNTRAYQNELVETEKVIRAQLMEALMSAQHYKARYDYAALLSQLSTVVGTEVRQKLGLSR